LDLCQRIPATEAIEACRLKDVAPSTVEAPRATELATAERMQKLAAANPMRRLVRPDEVAETVAFL
jgi:NAD(P)-dependent dehydrogenase (short-subunit alcohol dehydrogenase family)